MARVWPAVAASVGITLLLLTSTARLTLLDDRFDTQVAADADVYERLYTQVLPSPRTQQLIRQALADLPVDSTYVTSNLRLLVPPDVLEQVVARALRSYVEYLLGDRDDIDGTALLQPVVKHIAELVRTLLPGTLLTSPRLTQASLRDFQASFTSLLGNLRTGRADLTVPRLPLRGEFATDVAQVLTAGLPQGAADSLRPQVKQLLRAGDLSGAMALVVPAYLAHDEALLRRVAADVSETVRAIQEPLSAGSGPPRAVELTRVFLPLGLRWLTVLGAALVLAALAGLQRRRSSWSSLAVLLWAAGGTGLVVGILTARLVQDPLRRLLDSGELAPVPASVLADVDRHLRSGVSGTYLQLVALVLLAAFGCTLVEWMRRSAPSGRRGAVASGVGCASLASLMVAVLAYPQPLSPVTCNGSAVLCERRYDEVTYLTTHNAMASSDDGFLGATQDPDLLGQLDGGVRALMIDMHYWTTPSDVQAYLATLTADTRRTLRPLLGSLAPRDDVWLCHLICQTGASKAITQLRRLKGWLDSHRDAVVTLIVEDHTTEQDTRAALLDAGLRPLIATPPDDGAPWPTLGEMVSSNRRLVVFTERTRPDQGWLRNLYSYAAETPYEAPRRSALSCDPGRGPTTAPLFLLNNWISTPAPSREQAQAINRGTALLRRARACESQRGMRPNFVAVDFAQIGTPLDAINALNGVS